MQHCCSWGTASFLKVWGGRASSPALQTHRHTNSSSSYLHRPLLLPVSEPPWSTWDGQEEPTGRGRRKVGKPSKTVAVSRPPRRAWALRGTTSPIGHRASPAESLAPADSSGSSAEGGDGWAPLELPGRAGPCGRRARLLLLLLLLRSRRQAFPLARLLLPSVHARLGGPRFWQRRWRLHLRPPSEGASSGTPHPPPAGTCSMEGGGPPPWPWTTAPAFWTAAFDYEAAVER